MNDVLQPGSPAAELRRRLQQLVRNLWWSWNRDLDDLFRVIDLRLWREVNHNPIAFLQDVDPSRLVDAANDAHVLSRVIGAERALDHYLGTEDHWASWNAPGLAVQSVAYFSPEFALHESVPVYSGGLGVLAGDHLKACSDLGIKACGVTLLYRQGYFKQHIDANGRQQESYIDLDTDRIAIEPVLAPDGTPLAIELPVDDRRETIRLWQIEVGRCRLVLLEPVAAADRELRLYGGDRSTRIVQEIVIGVGGYRALCLIGRRPSVLHLNEGHSAFAILEAIAQRMHRTGQGFADAAAEVRESVVFTTHTPIEAGHDRFAPEMVLHFLKPLQRQLGLNDDELLGLGRVNPADRNEEFCMTVLGLKLSRHANAVSSLHGFVTRRMWRALWPTREIHEVPIGHVTNGAHVDTWLANEISELYDHYVGFDWRTHLCSAERWRRVDKIDDLELWSVKLALRARMTDFLTRRGMERAERTSLPPEPMDVHSGALTIGFARRFAAYKRAWLFFDDFERAKRLLTDPARPVRLIIAGKAHPADEEGKGVLQRLVEISRDPALRDHVFVVEGYDMRVSRHLLQYPRRRIKNLLFYLFPHHPSLLQQ